MKAVVHTKYGSPNVLGLVQGVKSLSLTNSLIKCQK